MLRKEICDKSKDYEVDLNIGPKQYIPGGSVSEKETMETFLQNQKKSFGLERGARQ